MLSESPFVSAGTRIMAATWCTTSQGLQRSHSTGKLAALDLGHVKYVVEQAQQMFGIVEHGVEKFHGAPGRLALMILLRSSSA